MNAAILALSFLSAVVAAAAAVFALTPQGKRVFCRRFRDGHKARGLFVLLAASLAVLNIVDMIYSRNPLTSLLASLLEMAVITYIGLMLIRQQIAPRITDRRPKTVLAVGAHPDDLELACSGTLAKLIDNGSTVHLLVLSDGRMGGDLALRPQEAREGALFMKAASLTQYGFPDTRMSEHSYELVQAIEEKILEVKPDLILTHSANDQHQDHQAVHIATLRGARRHSSILCYESPSVTRDFNPSFFVDISDYVSAKAYAVSTHRDQAGKPYMDSDKLRGISSFRGSQAKVEHAEGFEIIRLLDGWTGSTR